MLLDFYCTLVDLSDLVRSRGFDDFARRLSLPLGPGELYRRYTEMISSEPAQDAGPGFVPYRTSWLAAGRRLLAPFGRESAAGQFAGAYADLHARAVIFPEVPGALRSPGVLRRGPEGMPTSSRPEPLATAAEERPEFLLVHTPSLHAARDGSWYRLCLHPAWRPA